LEALGISIDGNEVKFAYLKKNKNVIDIIGLEKVFLRSSGVERPAEEKEEEETYDDAFGLEDSVEETATEPEAEFDQGENAIFNVLTKYAKNNLRIAVNISQSDVTFVNISENFGAKEKFLKKNIIEKLQNISKDIALENFDFITRGENEYTAFYHNNKLDMLHDVVSAKSGIKSNMKISLLDVNEVAIANLFTNMIDSDNEKSIVVYVGNEFSRIIFFEGAILNSLSQLIHEGYKSDNLLPSLYGKIIFEIETAEIEEVNNIIITGDGDIPRYTEFFKEKFTESKIMSLPFEDYFNIIDETKIVEPNSYAIPISLAWKVIEGRSKNFIDTNFLPSNIRKEQKTFTIAWHGFIIIAFIFFTIMYSIRENSKINNQIDITNTIINTLNNDITEIATRALAVDSLYTEIGKIEPQIALIYSIRPKYVLYSELLRDISLDVREINSLWLKNLSISFNRFTLQADALYRTRIHRIANTFENSRIINVETAKVMDKNIYNFNISGQIPGKKK